MSDTLASIKIFIDKYISKVHPYLFGQFIEHFPRQIYGGIYEEDSPFSDSYGFRLDVQEVLKVIKPSLLRWPGGNYTSGYHWRWGVGPKEERSSRKNPHWEEFESHHFGTTEFVEYCSRIGAEPLICVGIGQDSNNPTMEEIIEWVKYCNFKKGEEAELRKRSGHESPLNVKWWGIGNECYGPWQIGYYKDGKEYGRDALKLINAMKKVDPSLKFVVVGEDPTVNLKWNQQLLSNDDVAKNVEVLSWHHYYQIRAKERASHRKATLDLKKVERRLKRTIKLIKDTCQRINRANLIKIAVDEWNEFGWEEIEIEKNALPEQYDLAHALYTAGFLNILIRLSDFVYMANYSPIVNTRGLIYVDKSGVLLRSSYYVYKLYRECAGGFSLQQEIKSPHLEDSNALSLDISSVKMNDNLIYLFVINRDSQDITTIINIDNFKVKSSKGKIITGNDLRSYNDQQNPFIISIKDLDVNISGENLKFTFPKYSICLLYLSQKQKSIEE